MNESGESMDVTMQRERPDGEGSRLSVRPSRQEDVDPERREVVFDV